MRFKALIPLLLLCLAVRSHALGEEGKQAGEELLATLRAEMKELAEKEDNENGAALKQYLRQVQAALAQENNRQLEQQLENFGNYDPSEKVRQGVDTLKKTIKGELRKDTGAVIAELESILETARQTIARAEEPADLDKTLQALGRNRFANQGDGGRYDSNDADVRRLLTEVNNARQFVSSWQDYLQASNSGNLAQAGQFLRNLAGQETPLIPRSQIIARIEFEKGDTNGVAKIIEEVKSLDDMKNGIRKLNLLQAQSRNSGSENTELRESLQTLLRLEKTYREFLAGLPVSAEVIHQPAESSESGGKLNFIRLRSDLLLMVLPRCLALPEGFKALAGETVDHFLKRALEDATSRGDAGACRRIGEMTQLFLRSSNFNQVDLEALRDYAAGQSQLAAGQYMLAVVSFQKALKAGSDFIPPAKTGGILELIRKEHPVEYEQGMMEFLTPRPTPQLDYSRMPYRNYLPPGMRDGDPRAPGGTTVVLPVPAADPKTDAKPAATE